MNLSFLAILQMFSRQELLKLFFLSVLSISTLILDLVGVVILGLLISILMSDDSPSASEKLLDFLNIKNILEFENADIKFQTIALTIGLALFALRGVASILMTRSMANFLAKAAAGLASRYVNRIFAQTLENIQKWKPSRTYEFFTFGMSTIVVSGLSALAGFLAEVVLISALFLIMFIQSPTITFFGTVYILVGAIVITRIIKQSTLSANKSIISSNTEMNEIIDQSLANFREIYVTNSFDRIEVKVFRNREFFGKAHAKFLILAALPKYWLEIFVWFGITLFVIFTWRFDKDLSSTSIGFLLIVLSRVLPSLLRMITFTTNIRTAESTYASLRDVITVNNWQNKNNLDLATNYEMNESAKHEGIYAHIQSLVRIKARDPILKDVRVTAQYGEKILIDGVSGSGKTSLIDSLLGLIPISGKVQIDGINPREYISKNSNSVRYVSQTSKVTEKTVVEQVTSQPLSNNSNFENVLRTLELVEFSIPNMDSTRLVNYKLDYGASNISGGQRQKLIIARAIFNQPRILFLDESTNALDEYSEHRILENVFSFLSNSIVIVVSHKMRAFNLFDQVWKISNKQVFTERSV